MIHTHTERDRWREREREKERQTRLLVTDTLIYSLILREIQLLLIVNFCFLLRLLRDNLPILVVENLLDLDRS
jgi:hypothetical protein